jgi:predicted transcriptional regulator
MDQDRGAVQTLLDYVLEQLDMHKGEWRQIAEESEVPYDTLTKVAQRKNENPRVRTVQKLADYFRARERAVQPSQQAAG